MHGILHENLIETKGFLSLSWFSIHTLSYKDTGVNEGDKRCFTQKAWGFI